MYQGFQESDAIEVQAHNVTECSTQSITPITQVQCTDYTVDQLAELLGVKRRQVFNLAKTVKEAYSWEPESTFNPGFGKYSDRCLVEMRRLQACKNSAEYTALVASENQKPVIPSGKTSSALALPTRQTEVLESKLANIQGNLSAQNISVQDRVKLALTRISEEKQRTNNNQSALDEARKQQIAMKATQDALEEHEVYQQVKNAVKEQLLIEELQQQG
jgi:hypothetical protein